MTILDIGGGFNGTETQLELVSFGVFVFFFFNSIHRTRVKHHPALYYVEKGRHVD